MSQYFSGQSIIAGGSDPPRKFGQESYLLDSLLTRPYGFFKSPLVAFWFAFVRDIKDSYSIHLSVNQSKFPWDSQDDN
jgi:hypothetical protein